VVTAGLAGGERGVIVATGPDATSVDLRSKQLDCLSAGERLRVQLVVDDPSLEGPVAGLSSALEMASAPVVVIVAADMPFVTPAVLQQLVAALAQGGPETWAAVALDDDGHQQFACCAWRRDRLVEVLDAARSRAAAGRGIALRALVMPIDELGHARFVPLDDAALLDVDDPAGLQRARDLADARRAD
jgi:molybdopterin-guanine dinucleotide biosynthesis protein A